jgi:hypothetical protein
VLSVSAVRRLGDVFEDFTGLGIDTDFTQSMDGLNIEGIAQATATGFFLEFFGDDRARHRADGDRARLNDGDPSLRRQRLALVSEDGRAGCDEREACGNNGEMFHDISIGVPGKRSVNAPR